MATSGAQLGNRNGAKGAEFRRALKKALAASVPEGTASAGLRKVALAVVEAGQAGEAWAALEIANRLDGKSVQPIAGADGGPLAVIIQATPLDEKL